MRIPATLGLPVVMTPDTPGTAISSGSTLDVPSLRRHLREHGAVLLRGYGVGGVDGFDSAVRAIAGSPLPYTERSSPRSTIAGNVYTSTDYPPNEEIFLHNENSYQARWPLTLFFYCLRPPDTLGATPLADTREVYRAIDPAVREEFAVRGWMVVRNFSSGYGVAWQQVFGTDDRSEVVAYCTRNGMEAEWVGARDLRTRACRRAVHQHPVTGDTVWFNHVTFFHVTTLAPDVCAGLREMLDEADLPTNTYYGDGAPIPDDVVAHLRAAYRGAQRRFDWQPEDILVVDNMLAAHGREPFTGHRKIAVAMAEAWDPATVDSGDDGRRP
ncbi:TauD/TfdA family dioxygenase [Phytohabitans rumicis]|uniref:Protein AmbC n=1 Tax=Phytohabitans rumicis TaxID=1076125 RepID=A0A6V8LDL8_9ACTN|nr:TauD/TfdA family dioxygenase [Phytohabitans rumicis]GFJ93740.1 protein AmbC [Phytohabitans rumicis]